MKRTRTNDVSQNQTKRFKGYTLVQAMRTDDVEACKRMIANGEQVDNTPTKKAMMDCIEMGCVHVCTYMAQHMFMLDPDEVSANALDLKSTTKITYYDWPFVYLYAALRYRQFEIADAFLEHDECNLVHARVICSVNQPVGGHPAIEETSVFWDLEEEDDPLRCLRHDMPTLEFLVARLDPGSHTMDMLFRCTCQSYKRTGNELVEYLRIIQLFLDCGCTLNTEHWQNVQNPAIVDLLIPHTSACTTFIDHLKIDKILHENDAQLPLDIINLIHEYNGAPLRPLKNARELYL